MVVRMDTHRRSDVEDASERIELVGGGDRGASADCVHDRYEQGGHGDVNRDALSTTCCSDLPSAEAIWP